MAKKLISYDDQKPGLGLPAPVERGLNGTFPKGGGLMPSPLTDVQIRPAAPSEPTPRALVDGRILGASGTTWAWTDDECQTWETITTSGPPGTLTYVKPTADGEVLALMDKALWKSSGWGTPDLTFTKKVDVHGTCQFQKWSLCGDGKKFLTTEYSAGAGFPDSRYARMSLDYGETWQIVYDSEALHGKEAADASHLHGCAYDPIDDAWFISEGHGPAVGIYVSTDDGATWARTEATSSSPAHTVIVSTLDGLVMASDSADGGLHAAPRTLDPHDLVGRMTWAWNVGIDGTNGFGVHGEYDAFSGLVFFGYRTEKAQLPPMIVAGSVVSGGHVWSWPDEFEPYSDLSPYPLGNGRIVIRAGINQPGGGRKVHIVTATIPRPGVVHPSIADSGLVLGGKVRGATSVSVGPGSVAGGAQSVAIGNGATDGDSGQENVAIGRNATTTSGSYAVAIGAESSSSTNAAAIGRRASAAANSLAVGYGANTTSTAATATGYESEAAYGSTAIGYRAKALGQGIALGMSVTGQPRSVGLGTSTTANDQVEMGPRHLEMQAVTTPLRAPANSARLYLFDTGEGLEMRVAFPNGVVRTLAAENEAPPEQEPPA